METSSQLIANTQFYHDNMAHHESVLQWYRVFFLHLKVLSLPWHFFWLGTPPGSIGFLVFSVSSVVAFGGLFARKEDI